MLMELFDIGQQYLSIDLLLAVEIKVNRTFAQFGFSGDALDRDRLEAFFKKKTPSRFQDGVSPVVPLPFPSFFQSHGFVPLMNNSWLNLPVKMGPQSRNDDHSLLQHIRRMIREEMKSVLFCAGSIRRDAYERDA
jgi:hypothetical protein